MACNPKESTAVAHELIIVVRLEVEHDLNSCIGRDIRSGSRAIRNAEAKNNLVGFLIKQIVG
jgi:hypothetical protein